MRLTVGKKDYLVNALAKGVIVQQEEVKQKMTKILIDYYSPMFPSQIMELRKTFPEFFNRQGGWDYRPENLGRYVRVILNLDLPVIPSSFPRVAGSCIEKELDKLALEYESLCTAHNKLTGKLRCIFETVDTYKKLEMEFPEAHKLLLEYDKKFVKEESKCDSVESLRAELSQYKK